MKIKMHPTVLALALSLPVAAIAQALPAVPATHAGHGLPATPAVPAVPAIPATHENPQVDTAVSTQASQQSSQASGTNPGALHGVKGSVGALVGMSADERGDFDFNHDGKISQDEIVASNRINAAVHQGVAGPKFREIDTNNDKVLSPEELSYYHASLGKAPISLGLVANTLGQFDFDGDGTITQAEIDASARVNQAVKAGLKSSAFMAIDTNHDGVLAAEELRAYGSM